MKVIAIIPARGTSKRFPRKNVALLQGKPLLGYAIESAKKSEVFDDIIVSSEDDEILWVAQEYGASIHRRSSDLAADTVQLKTLCRAILAEHDAYDAFGLLLPTNPLRTAEDIREAFALFMQPDTDAVMSVVPHADPPERAVWAPKGYVEPYFDVNNMKRDQDLDQLYHDDGSIILAKARVFLDTGELYLPRTRPYFIDPDHSVDINHPRDLKLAECYLNRGD